MWVICPSLLILWIHFECDTGNWACKTCGASNTSAFLAMWTAYNCASLSMLAVLSLNHKSCALWASVHRRRGAKKEINVHLYWILVDKREVLVSNHHITVLPAQIWFAQCCSCLVECGKYHGGYCCDCVGRMDQTFDCQHIGSLCSQIGR